jgi:predicted alpha/beta hydrolase family esterase
VNDEEATMTSILIIPGLGGSGTHHWQTHWEQLTPNARRVEQADWDRPDLSAWLERLANAIDTAPGAVLVAHSLGCTLVAHLAARRPDLAIEAALLVAPADVDSARRTPQHLRSFAPIPRKRLPFRSMVVASANDPYIAIDRARTLSAAWGAIFIDIGASGHINAEAGFGPWPVGESLLDELISGRGLYRRHAAEGATPPDSDSLLMRSD